MGSGLVFCPTCGNLLLVENHDGQNIYACQTCPYVYYIDREISKSVPLKRKEVEPVLGGEEEWKNAPRTEARCPDCSYHTAYFKEVQIRSADEPATLFFRCASCGCNWREG
ncbi:transcription factor S [Chlorella sorokiniana]|uniref:DNA-directed RNA polymerase subunit n=1 Tax=Chlorella sorokiniana TaxID=3076 RepID=A0A2P6TF08_CHLSO|nr:transcription factor S [Chlorella sorokiniana]|eukprot:PRW32558.1 transcription factor S [Chlorella sorokiniana]